VKVFYDNNWKEKFGSAAEETAMRVIVHAQGQML
jgi:hypothetical protein